MDQFGKGSVRTGNNISGILHSQSPILVLVTSVVVVVVVVVDTVVVVVVDVVEDQYCQHHNHKKTDSNCRLYYFLGFYRHPVPQSGDIGSVLVVGVGTGIELPGYHSTPTDSNSLSHFEGKRRDLGTGSNRSYPRVESDTQIHFLAAGSRSRHQVVDIHHYQAVDIQYHYRAAGIHSHN